MTKAHIISKITKSTGIGKTEVSDIVESLMRIVKDTMIEGENVYLRGFGSFVIKHRATKLARNITQNTTIIIPEHNVPLFKPSSSFINQVKKASE